MIAVSVGIVRARGVRRVVVKFSPCDSDRCNSRRQSCEFAVRISRNNRLHHKIVLTLFTEQNQSKHLNNKWRYCRDDYSDLAAVVMLSIRIPSLRPIRELCYPNCPDKAFQTFHRRHCRESCNKRVDASEHFPP